MLYSVGNWPAEIPHLPHFPYTSTGGMVWHDLDRSGIDWCKWVFSLFQRAAMDLAPSAPPELAEVEYHWTEITNDFLSACKGSPAFETMFFYCFCELCSISDQAGTFLVFYA